MPTIKAYHSDVNKKELTSLLTSIKDVDGKIHLILDETIFFPTGGGQSSDTGTIENYHVIDVFEDDEKIVHHVISEDECTLIEGTEVTSSIDWDRRFDNMQRHCGEHILSGIFNREYGGVNRGFHMGDDYMTIDISLEENPDFKSVNWDMCLHAELCANEVVWNNEPVTVYRFNSIEEAEGFPVRKKLELDEEISIVCVGSKDNPSDSVACCGTHPNTSGQVGLIKIYKVESNKGMYRIYFEAGKRALLHYENTYDVMSQITNRFSAGISDVMDKIKAKEDKNKATRDRVYKLAKHLASEEEAKIRSELTDELMVYKYDIFTIDELLGIGRNLNNSLKGLLFLVHNPSDTVLLFSNGNPDCGKLVNENADIYGGKGGGRKESARAIFPKNEYIDVFIDLIEKHLR